LIQPNLKIGTPADGFEREADRGADHVMRTLPGRKSEQNHDAVVGERKQTVTATAGSMIQKMPAEAAQPEEPPHPTFHKSCKPADQEKIRNALVMARGWVDESIRALETILRAPDRCSKGQEALVNHFQLDRVYQDDRFRAVREIVTGFQQIRAGFAQPPFECDALCKEEKRVVGKDNKDHVVKEAGWVRRYFRGTANIHLCPFWFSDKISEVNRIKDIIHEMAHKFAGKEDEAYETYTLLDSDISDYEKLDPRKALDNADSFAAFARDVSRVRC